MPRWDAVAIATLVLAGVTIWGVIETRSALEATQRAWLTPIGAGLVANPERDRGIHFGITFANSGREPAVDVNYALHNDLIDAYDPQFTDLNNITVPRNTSCDGLKPKSGSLTPPSSSAILGFSRTFDTVHGMPPLFVDDRILNGSKFYVVTGCAVYNTYNKPHKTSFCYIVERHAAPINNQTNASDPPANQSNAAATPARNPQPTYPFATCATGFEAD